MALTAPSITSAILAAGPELKGPDWFRLATTVGVAVATWAVVPANLSLTGITSGGSGSGTVSGKVSVIPAPLPVISAAPPFGLLGLLSPSVTRAIGVGVAVAFNSSAQYQGVSLGVGAGNDTSKVTVANPSTLTVALQSTMNGSGLLGADVPKLAAALGSGISSLLLTGTGIGVVVGPASPIPASGTSLSQVL